MLDRYVNVFLPKFDCWILEEFVPYLAGIEMEFVEQSKQAGRLVPPGIWYWELILNIYWEMLFTPDEIES